MNHPVRSFACPVCASLVFFANSVCVTCWSALGYVRETGTLVALQAGPYGLGYDTGQRLLHPCANLDRAACNWLTDGALCSSCLLTRIRPADSDVFGMASWQRTEIAKRQLIFQLDFLGLPTTPRWIDPRHGLAFDMLSSVDAPVVTGHDSGVITIDMAEGDDPHREALRVSLAEPYRTLLGHLRHEIGHWYWEVLVAGTPSLTRFRALFGDEQADYRSALNRHYAHTGPFDWAGTHVSHYAASHPWEDWAETFAHYLHIRDTLQTAASWGVSVVGPDLALAPAAAAALVSRPSEVPRDFQDLIAAWFPLSFALNALNRSMGKGDLYPFVLPPSVLGKLEFLHLLVTAAPLG